MQVQVKICGFDLAQSAHCTDNTPFLIEQGGKLSASAEGYTLFLHGNLEIRRELIDRHKSRMT